jgi:hypothetical protein
MYPIVVTESCGTSKITYNIPMDNYIDINGNLHQGFNSGEKIEKTPPQPACIQMPYVDSFAQVWTAKANFGAVAYIGYDEVSSMEGLEIYMSFFKAIKEGDKILGDAFNDSLNYYVDNIIPRYPKIVKETVSDMEYSEPFIYTLYGDPSLRIGGIKQ